MEDLPVVRIVNDQNKELFCQWCEEAMKPRSAHIPVGETCKQEKLDG
jgi:hypothetical protein